MSATATLIPFDTRPAHGKHRARADWRARIALLVLLLCAAGVALGIASIPNPPHHPAPSTVSTADRVDDAGARPGRYLAGAIR